MASRGISDELRDHMRRIGSKGGRVRAERLTAEHRQAIAAKAGRAGGRAKARKKRMKKSP